MIRNHSRLIAVNISLRHLDDHDYESYKMVGYDEWLDMIDVYGI